MEAPRGRCRTFDAARSAAGERSVFRLDQAVIAVLALVEHVDGVCFRVQEHVERVAQQLRLQHGFLLVHRLDVEAFDTDDARTVLLVELVVGAAVERLFVFERAAAQALLKPGTMPQNLFFQLVEHVVDGGVHVAGHLFGADESAVVRDGHLNDVPVALHGKRDLYHRILREIPLQLGDLLFHQFAEVVGDFEILCRDRNAHFTLSLLTQISI